MTKLLTNLWNDESGAAAAEYVLILAIVGSSIAVAALALGNAIGDSMGKATSKINAQTY